MLVLMAIEDMLTDLGCTSITVAGNLESALELVATEKFDLATLDVNLNGQRSYPVADVLEAQGVPFAFSTGYGDNVIAEGHGSHVLLRKPYNCPQFTAVIASLLSEQLPPVIAS